VFVEFDTSIESIAFVNRLIYRQLKKLYPTAACHQHILVLENLEKAGGFSETAIPQLEDVSRFMKQRSGFQLRPCAGDLSTGASQTTDRHVHRLFQVY
jgi:phenylalanine-4-hydroxylase